MNGTQTRYVNPGCLKWISGINISPSNKNLITISLILHNTGPTKDKRGPTKRILLEGVFIPKLLNNSLASCS